MRTMLPVTMLSIALFSLAIAGCPPKKHPAADAAAAPVAKKLPAAPKKAPELQKPAFECPAAARVAADAPIIVHGAPGNEENTRVDLKAKTTAKVDLYKAPGGGEAVGKLGLDKGKAIRTSDTRVLIGKPVQLVAPGPQKLKLSFVDRTSGELVKDHEAVSAKVNKGDAIGYVHYGGEGSHYVIVDGCLGLIDSVQSWPELKAQKVPGLQWWVQVKGGWMQVDKTLIVAKRTTAL